MITHHELVLVTATLDNGATGTGWCITIGVGALSIASLINTYLAQQLVGRPLWSAEKIWEDLWQDCHFCGPAGITTMAIGAIDIALWDLRAKQADLPLYKLLGGMHDEVAVYASAVNLHLTQEELLTQMEEHLSLGYEKFKLKIGRKNFEEDIERVRAVRSLIGPERMLMLDANQRWKAGEAVAVMNILSTFNPAWIEEPILSDDIAGHAHLRKSCPVPVALGEQLSNKYEFWNYIRADAVDILQPNVWKVGGITEWIKIAHLAQHANLSVAPHNSLELSIHLVASIPNGMMVENIFGGNLPDYGIASDHLEIRNARLKLPQCLGHGVVFDDTALRKHELTNNSVIERTSSVHGGI